VARRVEQVEGEALMLEAHHRRGDRDAALALDRHPIRAHPPPLAARLDLARQLDRAAKQQQFLGQCGLAGVRMRNDRKGAPAQNLVGQGVYQSAFNYSGLGPLTGNRSLRPRQAAYMTSVALLANATYFEMSLYHTGYRAGEAL
jgi:hypothetical protein